MRWLSQQRGVVRYNCADSLDRTNAASYFGAVQALAEQCARLGLQVDATLARTTLPGGKKRGGMGATRPRGVCGAAHDHCIDRMC